jgi:hypothetical protein
VNDGWAVLNLKLLELFVKMLLVVTRDGNVMKCDVIKCIKCDVNKCDKVHVINVMKYEKVGKTSVFPKKNLEVQR